MSIWHDENWTTTTIFLFYFHLFILYHLQVLGYVRIASNSVSTDCWIIYQLVDVSYNTLSYFWYIFPRPFNHCSELASDIQHWTCFGKSLLELVALPNRSPTIHPTSYPPSSKVRQWWTPFFKNDTGSGFSGHCTNFRALGSRKYSLILYLLVNSTQRNQVFMCVCAHAHKQQIPKTFRCTTRLRVCYFASLFSPK